MKVEEIMSKSLICIDVNEPVRNALKLMEKKRVSRLLVKRDKKIVGIVTERDLAERLGSEKERKLSDAHVHVSSCYSEKLITVEKDAEVKEVAEKMLEKGISSIVVTDKGNIVGIVTKTDLIKILKDCKEPLEKVMQKDVHRIEKGSRLLEARKMMIHYGIKKLLVVEKNKLVGILAESDVAKALGLFRKVAEGKHWDEKMRKILVEDVMSSPVITLEPKDTIEKCAKLMLENDISGIPIVENEEIKGIVTKTDLVRFISKT
jgi:CBS domain-containing protein